MIKYKRAKGEGGGMGDTAQNMNLSSKGEPLTAALSFLFLQLCQSPRHTNKSHSTHDIS
jgi:hypothetical protein